MRLKMSSFMREITDNQMQDITVPYVPCISKPWVRGYSGDVYTGLPLLLIIRMYSMVEWKFNALEMVMLVEVWLAVMMMVGRVVSMVKEMTMLVEVVAGFPAADSLP